MRNKEPRRCNFCYKCGNEMYTDKTRPMVDDTDEIVAEEVNP